MPPKMICTFYNLKREKYLLNLHNYRPLTFWRLWTYPRYQNWRLKFSSQGVYVLQEKPIAMFYPFKGRSLALVKHGIQYGSGIIHKCTWHSQQNGIFACSTKNCVLKRLYSLLYTKLETALKTNYSLMCINLFIGFLFICIIQYGMLLYSIWMKT